MSRKFLTIYDVAGRFGVGRKTIYDWLREDPTFPRPYKLSAGCIRYDLSEIEAWEASRKVAA